MSVVPEVPDLAARPLDAAGDDIQQPENPAAYRRAWSRARGSVGHAGALAVNRGVADPLAGRIGLGAADLPLPLLAPGLGVSRSISKQEAS